MRSLGKPLPSYYIQASSGEIQECDYVFPLRSKGMQAAMKYLRGKKKEEKEKKFNDYIRYRIWCCMRVILREREMTLARGWCE